MLNVMLTEIAYYGQEHFEALIRLVKVCAYLIGIYLVLGSIFKLSQLGSNPQMSPKSPLIMFICGISIFSMIGGIDIIGNSIMLDSTRKPGDFLLPGSSKGSEKLIGAMRGVLIFMSLIGYIAFIRGWLLLNQASLGKDGVLGRGLTHIIGGVALVNVQQTTEIFRNSFFPYMQLPWEMATSII